MPTHGPASEGAAFDAGHPRARPDVLIADLRARACACPQQLGVELIRPRAATTGSYRLAKAGTPSYASSHPGPPRPGRTSVRGRRVWARRTAGNPCGEDAPGVAARPCWFVGTTRSPYRGVRETVQPTSPRDLLGGTHERSSHARASRQARVRQRRTAHACPPSEHRDHRRRRRSALHHPLVPTLLPIGIQ